MLEPKKDILSVGPRTLRGFSVRAGVAEERIAVLWEPERLKAVLGTVRSALGKQVRLLVGESFAYVAVLPFPSETEPSSIKEERAKVERLAGKHIPEDMRSIHWDYREVSLEGSAPGRFVQVVGLTSSFGHSVSPALLEAGFKIAATEPESCAVARCFADRTDSIILVFRGETVFVAGIVRGIVLSSMTSIASVRNETIDRMASFLVDRFGISPKTIVLGSDLSEVDLAEFDRAEAERAGYAIETAPCSAPEGLARKEDLSGEDKLVLSIEIDTPVSQTKESEPVSEEKSTPIVGGGERFALHSLNEDALRRPEEKKRNIFEMSPRTKWFAMIFFAMLLLGGIAIFFLERNRERQEANIRAEREREERAKPVPAPIPEATPENSSKPSLEEAAPVSEAPAFNRASFRITLLNGSGVSGFAGAFGEKLSSEGFVVIETGNADRKAKASSLRAKQSVPRGFLDEMKSVSGAEFSTETVEALSEESEADVVVVLGSDDAVKKP